VSELWQTKLSTFLILRKRVTLYNDPRNEQPAMRLRHLIQRTRGCQSKSFYMVAQKAKSLASLS